ncbi:MAG: hypothetical protein JWO67_1040 [Streptosporangiaceae bacterium]|nr:hypothetical protein [Streptosporangiaceae bacterium]
MSPSDTRTLPSGPRETHADTSGPGRRAGLDGRRQAPRRTAEPPPPLTHRRAVVHRRRGACDVAGRGCRHQPGRPGRRGRGDPGGRPTAQGCGATDGSRCGARPPDPGDRNRAGPSAAPAPPPGDADRRGRAVGPTRASTRPDPPGAAVVLRACIPHRRGTAARARRTSPGGPPRSHEPRRSGGDDWGSERVTGRSMQLLFPATALPRHQPWRPADPEAGGPVADGPVRCLPS